MALLETWSKAGIFVLLGAILAFWASRSNSRDIYKTALRNIENQEEANLKKWGDDLRQRENELHKEAVDLLQKHIDECKSKLETAEKEAEKWKQIAENQPKQPTHRK